MKKLFSILALSVMLLLPLNAEAIQIKTGCEKVNECPDANGKCQSVCTIRIEGNNTSFSTFNGTLNILGEGVKVTKLTPGDGWVNLTPSTDGKSIPISFTATSPITASSFLLTTISLELENSAADCSIELVNPESGITVTEKITTTTTVKTGATLPIAIIAVGCSAAVVIYLATKKNKKMYKI